MVNAFRNIWEVICLLLLDLTANSVQAGDSCLLAVFTDNSDDKSYPPGKRQYTLDFAYHGGIYRDVWMIAKSPVAITDAIDSQIVGGGGVFVHFDKISKKECAGICKHRSSE